MALKPYKVRVPLETELASFVSLGQKYMNNSHREVSVLTYSFRDFSPWSLGSTHLDRTSWWPEGGVEVFLHSMIDRKHTEGISFSSASEGSVHGDLVLCIVAECYGGKVW